MAKENFVTEMSRHPGAYDTFVRLSQLLMKQIDLYQSMHYYQSIKFALADFNFNRAKKITLTCSLLP